MEEKKKLWWKRLPLWIVFTCMTSMVLLWAFLKTESVKASVFEHAYHFYQTYENEMAFRPGEKNVGEIFYGTKAKRNANTGIRYTTIGWKVRVFNHAGALVETLYYELGGRYMTSVDVCTIGGYDYCLYRVTLVDLKNRLSSAGIEALNSPGCNIVFDACITTKINGALQGGMTDAGLSWGRVYTTYNGIVHAQDWSHETKESLKSYYNKTLDDLFYEVSIEKGAGIKTVSGEGKYCFGTTVNVQAECEDGYHFSDWTGSQHSEEESYSFTLYGSDVHLTANAKENQYYIEFDGAGGEGMIPTQVYCYNDFVVLPSGGFFKSGATLSGWRTLDGNNAMQLLTGQEVSLNVLVNHLQLQRKNEATIRLYAVWDIGPLIETEIIYASLQDAIAGNITEEWLSQRAAAYDKEDGEIPYGQNEKNAFFIEGYKSSDFTELQEEDSIDEIFFASDSAGNTTKKEIQIHVIDTRGYPADKFLGRVRFISKSYFVDENGNLVTEDEGGLANDSIWRLDETYRSLLEKLFK